MEGYAADRRARASRGGSVMVSEPVERRVSETAGIGEEPSVSGATMTRLEICPERLALYMAVSADCRSSSAVLFLPAHVTTPSEALRLISTPSTR